LRTIKDPEKPQTLEQLDVVYEDCINICQHTPRGISVIRVEFNPTVPHCSLATLIGLCIRVKLERHLSASFKLDIYIKKGAHSTEQESMFFFNLFQNLFLIECIFNIYIKLQLISKSMTRNV